MSPKKTHLAAALTLALNGLMAQQVLAQDLLDPQILKPGTYTINNTWPAYNGAVWINRNDDPIGVYPVHIQPDGSAVPVYTPPLPPPCVSCSVPNDGADGKGGLNGADGKNGKDGLNGADGKNGKDGLNGADGKNGKDGLNGADGRNGKDGLNGADGKNGQDGLNGVDGKNGQDGLNGADGKNGQDGLNGADGKNGQDGINGADGKNGQDGLNGVDGKNGKDGLNGADGKNGKDGLNGVDGKNGQDGINGADGKDGAGIDPETLKEIAQDKQRLDELEQKHNNLQAQVDKQSAQNTQADEPKGGQGGNVGKPIPKPVESPLLKALANLTPVAKREARAQLSGAANANLGLATFSGTSLVSNSALSAMRQLGGGMLATQGNAPGQVSLTGRSEVKPGESRLWVQALNNASTFDQPQGQKAFEQNTRGLVMGVDWALDDEWRMGLLGGKSQSKHKGSRFEGDLDSWHIGTYALHQSGPLALRLGAVHSSHYGKTQRNVEFSGYKDRLSGNYGANSQQVFGELGYNLGSGSLSAEPFANLGYQRYTRKGYTEKGGEAALKADAQTQDNFSTTLGLRTASIKYMDNKMSLAPRLSAGWKHMYGSLDSTSTQTHQLTGQTFNTKGITQDRDSLVVEAGLDLNLSAKHSIGVAYNGEVGNSSRTHGVMGQWKMSF